MQLLSCPRCDRKYDVTRVSRREFPCSCGATVPNGNLKAVDARIIRCGSCGANVTPEADTCEFCRSSIVRDRRQLSAICPDCYARNSETSQYCAACGFQFDLQPLSVDAAETACPACSKSLASRSIGDIPVHECPGCNGLWVTSERFNELMSRVIEARKVRPADALGFASPGSTDKPPFQSQVRYRRCPACNGLMQRKNFARRSGVIVDVCGMHGVWLDADELGALVDFVVRGGMDNLALVSEQLDSDGFQVANEDVLKARIEAEKLMARERIASGKRLRSLAEGTDNELLNTLGGVFRKLLELE